MLIIFRDIFRDKKFLMFLLLIFTLTIFGCAGKTIKMENKKGEQAVCKVSTAETMWSGVYFRNKQLNKCIKQLQRLGFEKM